MSNSTTNNEALLIDTIKSSLLSLFGIITIIVGTIGNLFNILLFTRAAVWRGSPCIPYLLGSSIASFFIIYTSTLMRMLLGFQITPIYYNRILCKIVVYVSTTSNVSATWFMIGACFDRYTSSSDVATRRLISNMRITKRVMVIITFLTLLIYTEILVCYESGNTVTITLCANKNTICFTLDACLGFLLQFIAPLLLTVGFGVGTFFNIKNMSKLRRIKNNSRKPDIPEATRRAKIANERAILRVVTVQVATFCICTFPNIVSKIYQLVPITFIKSDVRRSIENLILNMCAFAYTLDKAYSFYIYTLASGHFRKELKRLIYSFFRRHRIMPQI